MVLPEATNKPVPMDPPTAIMVRWRAARVRRSPVGVVTSWAGMPAAGRLSESAKVGASFVGAGRRRPGLRQTGEHKAFNSVPQGRPRHATQPRPAPAAAATTTAALRPFQHPLAPDTAKE